jgi:hypothetical protein
MIRVCCDQCGDDITDDDTWHHAHDGNCPVDFDESCCCDTYCARCCPDLCAHHCPTCNEKAS